MRNLQPVNVLLAATVSALVQGGLAVLFVPVLSFLLAASGGAVAPPGNTGLDFSMTFAVVTPVLCAIFGFLLGGLVASMFNMFVNQGDRPKTVAEVAELSRIPA